MCTMTRSLIFNFFRLSSLPQRGGSRRHLALCRGTGLTINWQ
jgi:hypothetical protein